MLKENFVQCHLASTRRASWVLLLLLTACSDNGERSEAGREAEMLCRASCTHQKTYCEGIDLAQCHELCAFVLDSLEDETTCLPLAEAQWHCDTTVAWVCSESTEVVGEHLGATDCATEIAAFERAGCSPGQ